MLHSIRRGLTVTELLIVVIVLAILIAILLPTLSTVRKSALMSKLQIDSAGSFSSPRYRDAAEKLVADKDAPRERTREPVPSARVKTFSAQVELTPRLSVGTAAPESIYEARFSAKIDATHPIKARAVTGIPTNVDPTVCELALPLPPKIISLADLSVKAGGKPSDLVDIEPGKLVWRGRLTDEPTPLEITYTAVGKGAYELSVPPGGILEQFDVSLTARGSDVSLLELSLQPTDRIRASGTTTYVWDYKRLLFGRPVRLDVLGIAPIDRLGELTWLGPISVVVFGLLVGLFVRAFGVTAFDRWMLLLTVGVFTGAYPLMYFAQEYTSLLAAVVASAGVAVFIIGVRAVTLMGLWKAMVGIVVPAAVILAITLIAAVWTNLQGILLTVQAIGFFIAAMMLLPRIMPEKVKPTIEPPPTPQVQPAAG